MRLTFYSYSQQSYYMASSIDRKSSPEIREINIEISNPHLKNEVKSIQNENKILKRQNQLLRKELDSLSNKLDAEIKRKIDEKVKPWHRSGDSTHLQLQNAYKKCQIYKKEANFYRKKFENLTIGQQKTVEIELCKDYLASQNKNLKQELKSLQKVSKFQQRGLQEMGAQGYLNVVNQNKRLNEEIKKLNRQLDQYRRGTYTVDYQEEQQGSNQKHRYSKNDNSSNTKNFKTEPRNTRQKIDSLNQSNYLNGIIQKNQRDYRKMKFLINQRSKLRQQLAYSKLELTEKDKQIDSLKNRILNLRKNNRFMQSQLGIKDKDTKDLHQEDQEKKSQSHKKLKQEPAKHRVWSKNKTHSVNDTQPRRQEKGSSPLNTFKWNHQNLASKIVEIKVLLHQDGHIKDLNIKYKKGQAKKLNTHSLSKFQSFSCRQGQYIKHISGCFSDGYLQCLSLITSQKRQKIFGNSFLLSGSELQSQKFQFLIDQNEYPGAFYGQNDEKGIRKLGCLIMKQ